MLPRKRTKLDFDHSNGSTTYTKFIKKHEVTTVPWILCPKRPIGCEFVNQHSHIISEILNCNSNIQVGDPSQVFYSTLYSSKSTQKEDAERQQRIAKCVIRRLIRQEHMILMGELTPQQTEFAKGISLMLSGLNAATSRDVVSAPMCHLLISQFGERFVYSHEFAPLLVNHMDDTLNDRTVNNIIRKTRKPGKKEDGGGTEIIWMDSLSEDYIKRPGTDTFTNMSLYEMTMNYMKIIKNWKQPIKGQNFLSNHAGYKYAQLVKRTQFVIPKVYFEAGDMCPLKDLDIDNPNPPEHIVHLREIYAKVALIQFYPFRQLDDIKKHDSHWNLFYSELKRHRQNRPTKFWKQGFTILQNIEDRKTMLNSDKRAKDEITRFTELKDPDEAGSSQTNFANESDLVDISELLPNE